MLKYISVFSIFVLLNQSVFAFCGFYVAKADTKLFNEASKVVMVRHDNKTVISMMNDYKGALKDFAMVIPVPYVLEKGQINVGNQKTIEHLDNYTAPRLVEYFDNDPCRPPIMYMKRNAKGGAPMAMAESSSAQSNKALGVTVEAKYEVGEYDILMLSAKESNGLETWLRQNGYKIPKGARQALRPYINMGMKFFVAKVNLKKHKKSGQTFLRPLQVAFESKKFMLPIRLGTVNAKGDQDLILFVLTKNGRVESSNYQTIKFPSNMDLPVFIKNDFADFYKDTFSTQVQKENGRAVFTEYFWDMSWCDPCAADPLSKEQLKSLGVFWLEPDITINNSQSSMNKRRVMPPRMPRRPRAVNVKVTRLHARYNSSTFPQDIMLQETKDTQNFQARYVIRHPWKGNRNQCEGAKNYFDQLELAQEERAQNLARLSSWDINSIRKKAKIKKPAKPQAKWWENIW